jgi:dTDP-4-amino-4,6-dideoxygalactose transaminase
MERLKLFDPPLLRGVHLPEVLRSKHLTTGPMVEELRRKLGVKFKVQPDQVVLGSSATACGFALLDWIHDRLMPYGSGGIKWAGKATWPLFRHYAQHSGDYCDLGGFETWWGTDIGGLAPEGSPLPTERRNETQFVIHDACHSCAYRPGPADFILFSFYPTKLTSGAEGGAMICENKDHAAKLQQILDCGYPRKEWEEMAKFGRDWDLRQLHLLARKANMTDVQAAFALEGLDHFNANCARAAVAWHKLKWAVCWRSAKLAQNIIEQECPYLFQIRVANVPRAREWFKAKEIPTAWNFPPAKLVTLPCHYMDKETVARLAEAVVNYYKYEQEVDDASNG